MSPIYELRISTAEQAKVLTHPLLVLRLRVDRVAIERGILGLDEDRRLYVESAVNRYLNACGCGTGVIFVLTALAAWIGVYVAEAWPVASSSANAALMFLSLLAAAALGRTTGRLWALNKGAMLMRGTLEERA